MYRWFPKTEDSRNPVRTGITMQNSRYRHSSPHLRPRHRHSSLHPSSPARQEMHSLHPDLRMPALREETAMETDLRVITEDRTIAGRTAEAVTTGIRDVLRTDSTRTEEVWEMADLRETEPADLITAIPKAVRAISVLAAAIQVITVALAIIHAIREEMADREVNSEITDRAKDLLLRQPARTWKRSVRKIRDVSVRKKISATKKI